MLVRLVLLVAAGPFFALAACSERAGSQAVQSDTTANGRFPPLTNRVVDVADLLRPEQEIDLSRKSEKLEAATGRQFVVVTVKTLGGEDVATYTRDLGRHWGIGRKGHDDGTILLVAPNENRVRIAVGYGLEATLTDALAAKAIQERILPRFRQGDMAGGIVEGADAVVKVLRPLPNTSQVSQELPAR